MGQECLVRVGIRRVLTSGREVRVGLQVGRIVYLGEFITALARNQCRKMIDSNHVNTFHPLHKHNTIGCKL